ncbi:MAG: nucleoside diphosphate kinase regulator [Tepidisphaeraceae bacterium]
MIAQNVMSQREIIITEKDFDRLRGVVDSPRYRATHAMLLMALKDELERGTIVAAGQVPKRVVTMHSQVRIRDLKADESETYTLVYPEEADINDGKLSVLAPLGTALLGTRVGQVVKFDAPAGQRRLKIERILYQPEAAGDFHL